MFKQENKFMDFGFSKIFTEIVSCGNITKAAEKLGYTQSGLSHTLNRAEEELGFKLFYRGKKGVSLTPEGKTLLPVAREMEQCREKMYETIAAIQGFEKGQITIGTIQSITINTISPILKAFRHDYPHIKIAFKEGSVQEIHDLILDHSVDIGFTSLQEDDEFECIPIFNDPLLAVVPTDYNSESGYFNVKDFEKYPFIMAAMEKDNDKDIDRIIKNCNLNLDVIFSSKDDIAIMSMVENGLGISMLPQLITLRHFQNIKTLPLNPPASRVLGVGLLSVESASPATLKFIEYLKKML